ncbi:MULTISPECIES: GspE/PulE family protein [Rhodopirellula]|jgi:general secretion pathway protein E/type IV pilus assembly protein PilB|uniref:Type IV-A pilus assembly ATPase PilB n=2 Tax=Rhodopirellula europaea TaxID=1263866 RepID=M5SC54_9BACT|nr:ATPase, T2SS/T4P/T4SS family [Rhodopirellula europaea]EMB14183.1 type IV-A pilus assembly ATPase PilB [Rhodopirellula europaea 6C]EMI25242.1 type IV-A pilus assembly ATPase PilB [Rhodopirellula europaea SH398]MCR9210032.1 ATPase, T2SS/T4P/T4SS family [bacterium]|tara:strand:- start:12484 stop:14175 length:1692 start_codon:yes stop_codon:yes gene_type:complete
MIMHAGEILQRRGLLTPQQLEQSRNGDPQSVVDNAVTLGYVSARDALSAIADEVGLEFRDLRTSEIDLSALEGFPQKLIYRHSMFPIGWDDGALLVATADPFDLYPLDEACATTGKTVVPVVAERNEISRLVKKHLGVGSETVEGLVAAAGDEEVELLEGIETDGSELSEMAQEASVVRLVNEILIEAVDSRASDIHIESQSDGLVIRYRIDGILHPQPVPPEINRFQAAIISRLKIMARLNIAEKRLPQDGRIKLRVHGREVDIRLSVIPMIHGEGLVMRVLDKSSMVFDLQGLGMSKEIYDRFSKLIKLPHGIVLVTGPTGSGKTTTLYSSLLEIRSPENKIITTEDPVEYQLDGINQIQVHSKIGLTFAASLRSILRHDPDIVLVGEIRDLETAENATQASLTGHMVFSTLHTNDAAGAFTRMVDMGVEPFLVAGTVEAVMAQRLLRRLCPHCKEAIRPDRDDLPKDFPWDEIAGKEIYRSVGCRECRNVGYSGRLGIYELLVSSEHIREMAQNRASSWDIRRQAVKEGMRTLRMDAWDKVVAGVTSVDEVLRVTKGEAL